MRLLEARAIDDASCARTRAWRERVKNLVTLELPRNESCSDSRLFCGTDANVSSLASPREQLAGLQSHTLSTSFSLASTAFYVSALSTQGPAILLHHRDRRSTPQASSLPDTVTPATVIFRTSICESSPRGCFACGRTSSVIGSAARLVSVDDLE